MLKQHLIGDFSSPHTVACRVPGLSWRPAVSCLSLNLLAIAGESINLNRAQRNANFAATHGHAAAKFPVLSSVSRTRRAPGEEKWLRLLLAQVVSASCKCRKRWSGKMCNVLHVR